MVVKNRAFPSAIAALLAVLLLAACETEPPSDVYVPYIGPGADVLERYRQNLEKLPQAAYRMEVRFDGELPRMGKRGVMIAERIVSADGQVRYKMISFEGDDMVKKDLIARYMSTETQARQEPGVDMSITARNYNFRYRGIVALGDRQAHLFQINPRRKRTGLFRGTLYIDSDTFFPLREEGRFVKSPSVFLKRIEFVRDFMNIDSRPVPSLLISRIETRFWGDAILQIKVLSVQAVREDLPPGAAAARLEGELTPAVTELRARSGIGSYVSYMMVN